MKYIFILLLASLILSCRHDPPADEKNIEYEYEYEIIYIETDLV